MANITFSEASGLQDTIFGKSQAPIRMFIESRGESFEQQSLIKELFSMEKSTHWGEKFTSMTAMEGFQPVGELGSHPIDGMQEGFSKFLENMTWKNSFAISREMVEDAKLMDLRKQPAAFITAYHRTRERFGASLFGNAIQGNTKASFYGKSFDVTTADGKALFATDHPSAVKSNKKTQSNKFADEFSVEALGAMETAMQDFRGDNNEILDVAPDTIVIANDYELKDAVFSSLGADKDPATSNNAFNYQYGRWNIIVWPYLKEFLGSVTSPWMLIDSRYSKMYGGAVWLDRTALEVNSRVDPDTNANVWSGYSRFTAGFNDWRFAAVGGITGGTQLIGA